MANHGDGQKLAIQKLLVVMVEMMVFSGAVKKGGDSLTFMVTRLINCRY